MPAIEERAADAVAFADLTTFGVGGPIRDYTRATGEDELIEALRSPEEGLFLLGGGSNVLAADGEFAGRVVHVATSGLQVRDTGDDAAEVTVAAGVRWDEVVAETLAAGLSGLEALSGIPGSAGATPVQNVGAYGAEVSQLITRVRVWDVREARIREFGVGECGFAYRDSVFKRASSGGTTVRFAVLDVTFRLSRGSAGAPVAYAELAKTLGVPLGGRAPAAEVREAVLALRAGKGMVLDPADADTRSAGSFFTNPILSSGDPLPEGAPSWPMPDGSVKTSAAWLIDHAGFAKGFGVDPGRASLSTKHTLALTNRGGASAGDILLLARTVRDGVRAAFGVTLHAEPTLLGLTL